MGYTEVGFFKLDVPDTYIVDESTPTVIRPDVTGVESFRWVELDGSDNEVRTLSNKQDLTVNTDHDMKVRLYVTQKGSCFTTYQDVNIKLSNVYLHSELTGTSNSSETNPANISSGKGNKMSPVNCYGFPGTIHGDYAMLYKVSGATTLNTSFGVSDQGTAVSVTPTGTTSPRSPATTA